MELPAISDAFRLVVWVIVGAATAISVFLGNAFEDNINYFFRKLANKHLSAKAPEPIPVLVKIASVVLFLVVIVGTAFASAAPDDDLQVYLAEPLAIGGVTGNLDSGESPLQATSTSDLGDVLNQDPSGTPAGEATRESPSAPAPLLGVFGNWAWRDNTEANAPTSANQYAAVVAVSSGNEAYVAAGFPDGTIGLFTLTDGELTQVGDLYRSAFGNRVNDLQFVSGAQLLMVGTNAGDLTAWSYSSTGLPASPAATRRLSAAINALAVTTDGQIVASGQGHSSSAAESDDSTVSFNLSQSSDLRQEYTFLNSNQKDIFDLAFTIEGELLVVGNAPTLVRFGLNEAAIRMDYRNATNLGTPSVQALLPSPTDGALAYVSLRDETVVLVNVKTEQKLQISSLLGGLATTFAVHPDNSLIAVGTTTCTVRLLDAATLEGVASSENLCQDFEQGWTMEIGSLAFSPDGNFLIAGTAEGVLVLNTQSE